MDVVETPQSGSDIRQRRVPLEESAPALPPLATGVLIALCTVKLLLHILTSLRHYGYFRDELITSTWDAISTGGMSIRRL